MHELPITQQILSIALSEAEKINAQKITAINIVQGDYTDYVPEIVGQYLEIISEGTIAEGAVLNIEHIPAQLRCEDCGRESTVEHFRMRCPICNSINTKLIKGKEFYINSMEVEEDGD